MHWSRALLMTILMAMVALSGCASEETGAEGTDADSGDGGAEGDTGSGDAGNGTDDTPDGADDGPADDADVDGLTAQLLVDAVNGTAPLTVNFTIESSDPNATWRLDFGDGNATEGAGTPAAVNHTYGVGEFSAILNVTGADGSVSSQQVINVTEMVATTGRDLGTVPVEGSGMFVTGTQGDTGCGVQGDVDLAHHDWEIPAEVDGIPAVITAFTVHMDIGTTNVDSDIYLRDPGGSVIGSSTDFNAPIPLIGSGSPTEDFTIEGSWVPGTYTLEIRACMGAAMEYSFEGTASLVGA